MNRSTGAVWTVRSFVGESLDMVIGRADSPIGYAVARSNWSDWVAAPATDDLSDAIDKRTEAGAAVELIAIKALAAAMRDNGWLEVSVDIEGLSTIETAVGSDGVVAVEPEVADALYHVAGNCPKRLYSYRSGEYRVTYDEVVEVLQGVCS